MSYFFFSWIQYYFIEEDHLQIELYPENEDSAVCYKVPGATDNLTPFVKIRIFGKQGWLSSTSDMD